MVGASKRRAQRDRSPSKSTSAGESASQKALAVLSVPTPYDGNRDEENRPRQPLVLNRNIDGSVTMWCHINGVAVPIQKRPAPSKLGREVSIGLNTFDVAAVPKTPVHQYDVLVGTGDAKRPLLRKLWASKALKEQLPHATRWIFDGEKIAYSAEKLERDVRVVVDLDAEEGRETSAKGKSNTHRVIIKHATTIRFDLLRAYLDGKADFSTTCLEAINFLDHLLRAGPSERLIPIKRSFFQEGQKRFDLGSGAEAFKGVYQSMRIAHNATGKHNLTVNVDVANGTFWTANPLSTTIGLLLRCSDSQLANAIRAPLAERDLKKLRRVRVISTHRKDDYVIDRIIDQTPGEKKIPDQSGSFNSVQDYLQKKYNMKLRHPEWPLVKMTKKETYLPLELVDIKEYQRMVGKLDERQTSNMIKFAVTPPQERWRDIQNGLRLLNWPEDKFLNGYGLKINTQQVTAKGRLLQAPKVQFGVGEATPGTSGRWDLKGKKFLKNNKEPLRSWGVCIMPGRSALDEDSVKRFMTNFMTAYKGHGGVIAGNPIVLKPSSNDTAKAVQETYEKTQHTFNAPPQILVFVLLNKDNTTYGRIKKSCECRYGIVSQCMQGINVQRGQPQYISNVLMKFNAKLGGTTSRAIGPQTGGPNGIFKVPTMIVAADVTHPAPRSQGPVDEQACSIAAVTTSMDTIAGRYNALVESNGYRVEMILPENWDKIWKPSVQSWMTNVSGGRLPEVIFYFRDGVSEGQFEKVINQELKDMKNVIRSISPNSQVKFVLIIATKRHSLRFFPPSGGDRNGNALPGTLMETAITHPYENDFFLCAHSAIKGTARPVHYHVLINEPNYPNEMLQTMIYEHSYQFMRSTTPVSLYPAIYYADIAAERGRYHDRRFGASSGAPSQPGRGRQESGGSGSASQSRPGSASRTAESSSSGVPSVVPPLMEMPGEKMKTSMWYI